MKDKQYIVVRDRHVRISEVLNDCVNLCVPTSRDEPLSSILQKICNLAKNETDPIFTSSIAYHITQTDIDFWNSGGNTYTDEDAQDAVALMFAAGTHTGITFTYNDAANSMSATVTVASYTDEQAQDAVGNILNVSEFTYNDAAPSISINHIDWIKIINAPAFLTQVPINILKAATGTNTINNGNFKQWWKWDGLTGIEGLLISSSSTLAANSLQRLLSVTSTGLNGNAGESTTNIYVENTHTGANSINIGINALATSAEFCTAVKGQSNGAATQSVGGYFIANGGSGNIGLLAEATGGGDPVSAYFSNDGGYKVVVIRQIDSTHFPSIEFNSYGTSQIYMMGLDPVDGSITFNADQFFAIPPTLRISQTGRVSINDLYSFPIADGLNGQALVTDGGGNVDWATISGGGGGSSAIDITFNATTDWGAPSSGYYSFLFTHALASNTLLVTVWDETGAPVQVFPEIIERTNTNTVTIKVPSSPDERFAGRIVVIA